MRLDSFLKENKFYETREKAVQAIKAGYVLVNGTSVVKPSAQVNEECKIKITKQEQYVSRGSYKLLKALQEFLVEVAGKVVLDIGASTGGFTQVLLQHNAKQVICIDTGSNQLHESIKKDPRVEAYEKTDFRTVENKIIEKAQLVVIDVSFISLKLLMPKLNQVFKEATIVCLVKPQFECGPQIAKKSKGVITNKTVHDQVLADIKKAWEQHGYYVNGLTHSPIMGGSGNREYLMLMSRKQTEFVPDIKKAVEKAFREIV